MRRRPLVDGKPITATDLDIEISHDEGLTWSPLRPGFKQGGRVERIDGDVMVQSVGRGRFIWYRIRERPDANERSDADEETPAPE